MCACESLYTVTMDRCTLVPGIVQHETGIITVRHHPRVSTQALSTCGNHTWGLPPPYLHTASDHLPILWTLFCTNIIVKFITSESLCINNLLNSVHRRCAGSTCGVICNFPHQYTNEQLLLVSEWNYSCSMYCWYLGIPAIITVAVVKMLGKECQIYVCLYAYYNSHTPLWQYKLSD